MALACQLLTVLLGLLSVLTSADESDSAPAWPIFVFVVVSAFTPLVLVAVVKCKGRGGQRRGAVSPPPRSCNLVTAEREDLVPPATVGARANEASQ